MTTEGTIINYVSKTQLNEYDKWRVLMSDGIETGERRAFSESFQPFRAEPHEFYIYPEYTILYLSCNKICTNKMLFNLIKKR